MILRNEEMKKSSSRRSSTQWLDLSLSIPSTIPNKKKKKKEKKLHRKKQNGWNQTIRSIEPPIATRKKNKQKKEKRRAWLAAVRWQRPIRSLPSRSHQTALPWSPGQRFNKLTTDNGRRMRFSDDDRRDRPSSTGKKGSNGRSKSIESFQRLTVRNNTEVLRRKLCPTDCVTQAGSPRTYVNVMDDGVMDYVIRYVTLRRSR